jgi:hypothetical protein
MVLLQDTPARRDMLLSSGPDTGRPAICNYAAGETTSVELQTLKMVTHVSGRTLVTSRAAALDADPRCFTNWWSKVYNILYVCSESSIPLANNVDRRIVLRHPFSL